MPTLTPDEVRAATAGPVMDEWIAVRFFDYVYVNGTEEKSGVPYTLCYPRQKAEEWVRMFKSSSISDTPATSSPYPYLSSLTRWSSDPAACTELERRLWASGKFRVIGSELYCSKTVEPHVTVFVQPFGGRAVVYEEPVGADPIAAKCLAWCKVAIIAELHKGGG